MDHPNVELTVFDRTPNNIDETSNHQRRASLPEHPGDGVEQRSPMPHSHLHGQKTSVTPDFIEPLAFAESREDHEEVVEEQEEVETYDQYQRKVSQSNRPRLVSPPNMKSPDSSDDDNDDDDDDDDDEHYQFTKNTLINFSTTRSASHLRIKQKIDAIRAINNKRQRLPRIQEHDEETGHVNPLQNTPSQTNDNNQQQSDVNNNDNNNNSKYIEDTPTKPKDTKPGFFSGLFKPLKGATITVEDYERLRKNKDASLDYHKSNNNVSSIFSFSTSRAQQRINQCFVWISCICIALLAGAIGASIRIANSRLNGLKFELVSDLLLKDQIFLAWLAFCGIGGGLMLICIFIALCIEPRSIGGGLLEIKSTLNGVNVTNIFTFKHLISRYISSLALQTASVPNGILGTNVVIASILSGWWSTIHLKMCKRMLFCAKEDDDLQDFDGILDEEEEGKIARVQEFNPVPVITFRRGYYRDVQRSNMRGKISSILLKQQQDSKNNNQYNNNNNSNNNSNNNNNNNNTMYTQHNNAYNTNSNNNNNNNLPSHVYNTNLNFPLPSSSADIPTTVTNPNELVTPGGGYHPQIKIVGATPVNQLQVYGTDLKKQQQEQQGQQIPDGTTTSFGDSHHYQYSVHMYPIDVNNTNQGNIPSTAMTGIGLVGNSNNNNNPQHFFNNIDGINIDKDSNSDNNNDNNNDDHHLSRLSPTTQLQHQSQPNQHNINNNNNTNNTTNNNNLLSSQQGTFLQPPPLLTNQYTQNDNNIIIQNDNNNNNNTQNQKEHDEYYYDQFTANDLFLQDIGIELLDDVSSVDENTVNNVGSNIKVVSNNVKNNNNNNKDGSSITNQQQSQRRRRRRFITRKYPKRHDINEIGKPALLYTDTFEYCDPKDTQNLLVDDEVVPVSNSGRRTFWQCGLLIKRRPTKAEQQKEREKAKKQKEQEEQQKQLTLMFNQQEQKGDTTTTNNNTNNLDNNNNNNNNNGSSTIIDIPTIIFPNEQTVFDINAPIGSGNNNLADNNNNDDDQQQPIHGVINRSRGTHGTFHSVFHGHSVLREVGADNNDFTKNVRYSPPSNVNSLDDRGALIPETLSSAGVENIKNAERAFFKKRKKNTKRNNKKQTMTSVGGDSNNNNYDDNSNNDNSREESSKYSQREVQLYIKDQRVVMNITGNSNDNNNNNNNPLFLLNQENIDNELFAVKYCPSFLRKYTIPSFNNDPDRQMFVSIGVAAGVASSLSTPLGGLLYLWEEMATHHFITPRLTILAFAAATISALLANFLTEANSRKDFGIISATSNIFFHGNRNIPLRIDEIPAIIILGLIIGIIGSCYTYFQINVSRIRAKFVGNNNILKLTDTLLLSLIFMTLCFMLPYVWHCEPINFAEYEKAYQLASVDSSNSAYIPAYFTCNTIDTLPEDRLQNRFAALSFIQPDIAIKRLLVRGLPDNFYLPEMCIWFVIYFVFTIVLHSTSSPWANIIPLFMLGSLSGRIYGRILWRWWGNVNLSNPPNIMSEYLHFDPGLYAGVATAALFAAITRSTVSMTFIVLEMTSDMGLLLPMLIGTFIAHITSQQLTPALFSAQIIDKKLSYLPILPPDYVNRLFAKDIMIKIIDHCDNLICSNTISSSSSSSSNNNNTTNNQPISTLPTNLSLNVNHPNNNNNINNNIPSLQTNPTIMSSNINNFKSSTNLIHSNNNKTTTTNNKYTPYEIMHQHDVNCFLNGQFADTTGGLVMLGIAEKVSHIIAILETSHHSEYPVILEPCSAIHHNPNLTMHVANRYKHHNPVKKYQQQKEQQRQQQQDGHNNHTSNVISYSTSRHHNGFRCQKNFVGLIKRKHLYILLNRRTWRPESTPFSPDDWDRANRRPVAGLDELRTRLTSQDLNSYLDLAPWVNLSSVTTTEMMNATIVYKLFTSMALRHLPVVNAQRELVGIITRLELTHYMLDYAYYQKYNDDNDKQCKQLQTIINNNNQNDGNNQNNNISQQQQQPLANTINSSNNNNNNNQNKQNKKISHNHYYYNKLKRHIQSQNALQLINTQQDYYDQHHYAINVTSPNSSNSYNNNNNDIHYGNNTLLYHHHIIPNQKSNQYEQ